MNTIAVQTECSESEFSNCVPKNCLKPLKKDEIHSKPKKSHSLGFKENATGHHHQPGEIPKY